LSSALHGRKPNSKRLSLSYDGKDFVRNETTLMKDGQSAANTKLDRDGAAYKALVEKHSYTGPAFYHHSSFSRLNDLYPQLAGFACLIFVRGA
jgi:hypothetical protein